MSRPIDANTLKAEFTGNFQDGYTKPEIHALIDLAPTVNGCISVKDGLPDKQRMEKKIEFIESYIKVGDSDYQWHDNHGELIRCGNCKYCYYASNRIPSEQTHACGKHGINVTRDWFCADGKRR